MQFSILHCRMDCFSVHSSSNQCPKEARKEKDKSNVRKTESL